MGVIASARGHRRIVFWRAMRERDRFLCLALVQCFYLLTQAHDAATSVHSRRIVAKTATKLVVINRSRFRPDLCIKKFGEVGEELALLLGRAFVAFDAALLDLELLLECLLAAFFVSVQVSVRAKVRQQVAVALGPLFLVGHALQRCLRDLRQVHKVVVVGLLLERLFLRLLRVLFDALAFHLEPHGHFVVRLLLAPVLTLHLLVLFAHLSQEFDLRGEHVFALGQGVGHALHHRSDLPERLLLARVHPARRLRRALQLGLQVAVPRHAPLGLQLRQELVQVAVPPPQNLLRPPEPHQLGPGLRQQVLLLLVHVGFLAELGAVRLELLARHELAAAHL
mmetsp:Transcript_1032/g.2210  ORF Transcript_1032/g.2210 Transcript_1032/m.2210 type:complete len:338 (+) Transcript_1032:263-1276(+)